MGSCLSWALMLPQAGQRGQGTAPGLTCRELSLLPCEKETALLWAFSCCGYLRVTLEKSRWASVYILGNVGQLKQLNSCMNFQADARECFALCSVTWHRSVPRVSEMWGYVKLLHGMYSRKSPSAEGIGKRLPRKLGRKATFTVPPDKALHTWLVGLGRQTGCSGGFGQTEVGASCYYILSAAGNRLPGEQLGSSCAANPACLCETALEPSCTVQLVSVLEL